MTPCESATVCLCLVMVIYRSGGGCENWKMWLSLSTRWETVSCRAKLNGHCQMHCTWWLCIDGARTYLALKISSNRHSSIIICFVLPRCVSWSQSAVCTTYRRYIYPFRSQFSVNKQKQNKRSWRDEARDETATKIETTQNKTIYSS